MTTALPLTTSDGVSIIAWHDPGPAELCFVLAHGFTGAGGSASIRAVAARLTGSGGVLALDLRGHGLSGGESTLGDLEIHDVAAGVAAARELGYAKVATIGFSMGASVVVRHAGNVGADVDAVISVSGPAFWHYRGTPAMRWVHRTIGTRVGRGFARIARGTRIAADGWQPAPEPPDVVAPRIAPVPFLIVHGDQDGYFPLEHAHRLQLAAGAAELWIEADMGHAEAAATPALVARIAAWARGSVGVGESRTTG